MLEKAVENGSSEDCLSWFEAKPGDCVFLSAGAVHAIGAGIVLAEIQQASDVTYRLYDWNRMGVDGKPRQLHIPQAMDVIDFDAGPVAPQVPQPTGQPHVSQLVACDKFVLNRWRLNAPQSIAGDGRFHILTVLQGKVAVEGDPANRPLGLAETIFLPASSPKLQLTPDGDAVLLEARLPD
ncbi:MAG: class I mannose-6-phosphate isomerase, partial [Planctomycetales bacterium]